MIKLKTSASGGRESGGSRTAPEGGLGGRSPALSGLSLPWRSAILAAAVPAVIAAVILSASAYRLARDGRLAEIVPLALVSLAVIGVSAFTGHSFGRNALAYISRIAERLSAMIEPRPVAEGGSDPFTAGVQTSDIDKSLLELERRFRAEFALYSDALEEIQVLDRERTAQLGVVARELIEPLGEIMERSSELIGGQHDRLEEPQLEDVRIIRQASERLYNMVSEILNLSSLASGIELDEEPVDLASVAAEVVTTARGQIQGKPVGIALDVLPGGDPRVIGSRRHIWQVLMNLVANGIKFTDRGEIRVIVGLAEQGFARVTVADTGVGIPQGELIAIFDPFRQSGDSSKKKRGTGLGLAICKRLVELHKGRIQVESVLGKGSSFTVFLPLARAARP